MPLEITHNWRLNSNMTKGTKLLLPWYRYPPFRASGIGGLSVTVWELSRELAERGILVDVLTPANSNDPPIDIRSKVNVISSELGAKFFHNERLKQDEIRTMQTYDAILSINNYAARTLHSIGKQLGRVIRQIHTIGQDRKIRTYSSLKPNILEILRILKAKRSDQQNLSRLTGSRTICVSNYLKHEMQERGLESATNLFMIPNGIHQKYFRPMNLEKQFDILFVGRFQKAKGLDILLDALHLAHSRWGETYKLGIVGEFTDEQQTFLLNSTPPTVRESTKFLGTVQREEMPRSINSAKLVLIPSRYESFGLPALEAIACGVPVLATKVGGLPEIIDESVGSLLQSNDPGSLAQAIRACLKDASLTERVVSNGPIRAAQYDWSVIAPRILHVLFP